MNPAELQQLKSDYILLAAYFGTEIQDDVLVAYANDLADMPYEAVKAAMTALRRDPKTVRLPLPSAIRAKLTPESNPESEATMIVGRIVEAIARIGPYETKRAKEAIGPVGWALVSMEGGWEHLCSVETDKLPTLKAQWRGLAKSLIDRGVATEIGAPRLENRSGERALTSFSDTIAKLAQRPEGDME